MASSAQAAFEALVRQRLEFLRETYPRLPLHIDVSIGEEKEFPQDRNYAYSAWDGDKAKIVFAPKIVKVSPQQQEALLRHELAHAILQHADLDHTERECDQVAERLFGDLIFYDARFVQTLDGTVPGARRPRPSHLPK